MARTQNKIIVADVIDGLAQLDDRSVQCCITSPPYWGLRNYGVDGQIGLEPTPELFVERMVEVFREVRRVLRDDGTLWLNLGDSYAGSGQGGGGSFDKERPGWRRDKHPTPKITQVQCLKPKDLIGIPWRVALAFQADGWWLRSDIIWHKPNPMPESCRDRPTKSHEHIFLLTKAQKYYYDAEAIREEGEGYGRSKRFRGSTYTNNRSFNNADKDAKATGGGGSLKDGSGRNKRDVWVGERSLVQQFLDWKRAVCERPDVWTMTTRGYKEAHFATFPPELPETCIKAGTSMKGCCPGCGAPWPRLVHTVRKPTRPGANTKIKVPSGWETGKGSHGSFHREGRGKPQYRDTAEIGNRDPQRHVSESMTIGWEPGCTCRTAYGERVADDDPAGTAPDPIPCTILDPFFGAGTTGLVAQRLGRQYIGIELNPEYAAMARRRIKDDMPLFAEASSYAGTDTEQANLFEG